MRTSFANPALRSRRAAVPRVTHRPDTPIFWQDFVVVADAHGGTLTPDFLLLSASCSPADATTGSSRSARRAHPVELYRSRAPRKKKKKMRENYSGWNEPELSYGIGRSPSLSRSRLDERQRADLTGSHYDDRGRARSYGTDYLGDRDRGVGGGYSERSGEGLRRSHASDLGRSGGYGDERGAGCGGYEASPRGAAYGDRDRDRARPEYGRREEEELQRTPSSRR